MRFPRATRHLLVDTLGLILCVVVHQASLQDRDGAQLVLDEHTRRLFPFLEKIFAKPAPAKAGGAYGGEKLRRANDYENLNRTAFAFIRRASIRLMLRRLTRYCYPV